MKIISKYKDYYDYLQGIWGIDVKVVYDRTNVFIDTTPMEYGVATIFIGNVSVQAIWLNDMWLCGKDIAPYAVQPTEYEIKYQKGNLYYKLINTKFYNIRLRETWVLKESANVKESPCDVMNCPIVISTSSFDKKATKVGNSYYRCSPILATYNIQKVLSPNEVWLLLYDWISKEKVVPNTQTNKDKILAAGFDLKSSFRNIK